MASILLYFFVNFLVGIAVYERLEIFKLIFFALQKRKYSIYFIIADNWSIMEIFK